jgi:hypothetical protein
MDTYTERGLTPTDPDPSPRARAVLRIGIGLYLLVLGALGGTLVERIRFDLRREPVLARYDALLRARNARLMEVERAIAQRSGPAGVDLVHIPVGMQAAAAGH